VDKAYKSAGHRGLVSLRVDLHLFGHTRLTELASSDLGEQTLKALAGWSSSSKMAGTYVHLSTRNVEESLLSKAYGIKMEDKTGKEKFRVCHKCDEVNPYFANLCQRCKTPLNEKELVQATLSDEKVKEIEDWSKTMTAFLKVVEQKHPDIWEDMKNVIQRQ
jgi:ribosomal protein L40E